MRKVETRSISFDREVLAKIDEDAKVMGFNRSQYITFLYYYYHTEKPQLKKVGESNDSQRV